ncbi:hypothetical protein L9F63_000538 [Diploptera punctata]|uniref:JmjC domain-containing protein n=1 Tax=Diploptera punctata TaxID=6984 RepID=A0AAD8ET44_DIPPU|nr:hypothetical protein L9F63_000538 [Diploptera punctata]
MHFPVTVYENVSREQFIRDIHPKREPALLKRLNVGDCSFKWTCDYICDKAENVDVKVHVCPGPRMDFITKNFAYKTIKFHELLKRVSNKIHESKDYFISPGEFYYLRSLSFDNRGREVADVRKQFPALAEDIIFPNFFDEKDLFSSVLRVGSPGVQLWTHYDVMDNLLIQVVGRKRMVLFSPADALNMYLTGDKSQVLDIDNPDVEKYPKFLMAKRYECVMEPGDVLFIPALWFHNALALDFGIAVNVFWKNLEEKHYDKSDVYGNKDPIPATRALQAVNNGRKQLDNLPREYKDFYIRRMIAMLETELDK